MASQMVVPASKDTLFIRGFSARQNIEDIRDFFARDGGRSTVEFFKQSEDKMKLFVALRFESKDIAKEILNRFDNAEVLNDRITISWFKDLRRARAKGNSAMMRFQYTSPDDNRRQRMSPERGFNQGFSRFGGGGRFNQRNQGRWRSPDRNRGSSRRYDRSYSRSRSRSYDRSYSRSTSRSPVREKSRERIQSRSRSPSPLVETRKSRKRSRSTSEQNGTPAKENIPQERETETREVSMEHESLREKVSSRQERDRSASIDRRGKETAGTRERHSEMEDHGESNKSKERILLSPTRKPVRSMVTTVERTSRNEALHPGDPDEDDEGDDNDSDDGPLEKKPDERYENKRYPLQRDPVEEASSSDKADFRGSKLDKIQRTTKDYDYEEERYMKDMSSGPMDRRSPPGPPLRKAKEEPVAEGMDYYDSQYPKGPVRGPARRRSFSPEARPPIVSGRERVREEQMVTDYPDSPPMLKEPQSLPAYGYRDERDREFGRPDPRYNERGDPRGPPVLTRRMMPPGPPAGRPLAREPLSPEREISPNMMDEPRLSRKRYEDDYQNYEMRRMDRPGELRGIPPRRDAEEGFLLKKRERYEEDVLPPMRDTRKEYYEEPPARPHPQRMERERGLPPPAGPGGRLPPPPRERERSPPFLEERGMGPAQRGTMSSLNGTMVRDMERGIIGLPQDKMGLVREKKDEIEKAYRLDCETFAAVTKMLISKDPSFEERLQQSLRENLKDIGQRCIQELRDYIARLRVETEGR